MNALRCANHPDTETYIRCNRCDKPICLRCTIQTPVGGRCRQCADLRKPPLFQVGAHRYARAAAYGLVVGLAGGYMVAELGRALGFSSLLILLLGYAVGEAVSRGADRRLARGLAVMAGVLTVFGAMAGRAAFIVARLPDSMPLSTRLSMGAVAGIADLVGSLIGLLFLVLAVVIAVSRVR